jgi:diacylglycerol kinase (ATP)
MICDESTPSRATTTPRLVPRTATMHVALVHNVTAGDREFEPKDLVGLLRDAGHEVTEFAKTKRDVRRAIASHADVLAVAGGDGTVAKAAVALRDSELPLVVLPTGTANNIARSLGVAGPVPAIIRGLPSARTVRLDIGHLSAPWGEKTFVEAAGVGFLAATLRGGRSARARLKRFIKTVGRPTEKRVRGAARGIARLIGRHVARYYEVRADGENLSDEYLAVEAMNIREIGPRLPLAPHADPGDGLLDLVLVKAEDRAALVDYIASLGAAAELPPTISRRVRSAVIAWPADDGHVDDKPWPRARDEADEDRPPCVRVGLQGAISVLVPQPEAMRHS